MTDLRAVYFNGKFYAGALNGVHRVADRLIREVDTLLWEMPIDTRPEAVLFIPEKRRWQPTLRAITVAEQPGAPGQRWEQRVLPRLARGGVLVNLANLAPLSHPDKILLLHDAQFLFPDSSYPWRQRIGYRLLVPRMARSSAIVLTVSDYSRQMLDLLGVSARARTRRMHNGGDHIHDVAASSDALSKLGIQPLRYVLLFGSAKAYKNNRVVFDALATDIRGLRLVVIGPDRHALHAAGLTPPPGTVFAGACDDAALRALYEGAYALLFPSRTEGFGLPPVEAMLCGCPAIVTPAGALPEVCRDAVLYADVDDPASWRQALSRLADPELRAAKIAAGRALAARYRWRAAGEQLLAAILERASVRDDEDANPAPVEVETIA